MDVNNLNKANTIKWRLDNLHNSLKDINTILANYNEFGSEITFKLNKIGFTRSFGTKKHGGNKTKEMLKNFLQGLKTEYLIEIEQLETEFNQL